MNVSTFVSVFRIVNYTVKFICLLWFFFCWNFVYKSVDIALREIASFIILLMLYIICFYSHSIVTAVKYVS